MNMSRTSLNRKVRGTLDQSPNNYIRIERLKAAAEMLKVGDKKVNEVCYSVGFPVRVISPNASMNSLAFCPKNLIKNNETFSKNNPYSDFICTAILPVFHWHKL